ncbi:nuclease-related domain-containing protein [Thiocapsa roseopersicina]|uniref:Nuclease-related domain-containing protein n=1 Tax=Thiocapsa roseopersicina TaxID=1058 RepID=A0A1H2ZTG9_THIRO|nr:nuclease-related domain-containing protein [Thiocapsa roseopersicina]SDX20601.1 Nuclease-related domain-containing protein [Thiocapsa roseopersicina]
MSSIQSIQGIALIIAMVLIPMLIVVLILTAWKRFVRNRNRRSPLTSELLRTPGFGLRQRIEDLTLDMHGDLMVVSWVPLLLWATYQVQSSADPSVSPWIPWVYAGIAVAFIAYQTLKIVRQAAKRQKYAEGLDGELATAQLLEPIIAGGGRVLHDIQAPGFNIDHVVVAPGGVFSVETKHRLKSTQGKAAEQTRVAFDGTALTFPGWTDVKTAEQARAQGRWLSERLTKSAGIPVAARPVIALPGWYVRVTKASDVVAINPKTCRFMLKPRNGEPALTADSIQRIAFQVEQLCRIPDPGGSSKSQR